MGKLKPVYVRLAAVLVPMIVVLVIAAIAKDRSPMAAKPRPPVVVSLQTVASKAPAASATSQPPDPRVEDASPPPWDPALLAPAPFQTVLVNLHSDLNFPLAQMLDPELTARSPTVVSPGKLRELMDRGVVGYASAGTRDQKIQAAKLIALAARLGYGPARDLIARNYPRSEAMQSLVPAVDAIRYTFALLTMEDPREEDADAVFLGLVQYAAANGTMGQLARKLADLLRADRRAHLSHRIDVVMGLLARVPGACAAIGRVVATAGDQSPDECSVSLSQDILRFAQSSGSP